MNKNVYLELTEQNRTRKIPLDKSSILIGRAPDCDLVLPFSQISRHHARLFREGEQYCIEDLKSANGTSVNGKAVESHLLKDRDEIRLGTVQLAFHNPIAERIHLSDEYQADAHMTIAVPIAKMAHPGRLVKSDRPRDPGEMIQVIFDATKTLIGFNDMDGVLSGVMELVFEYLKADRGFLMLYHGEEDQLVPYVVKQRKEPSKQAGSINFSRTIVNKVFKEGVSILTANAMQDSRFGSQESIMIQQIRSCMCVPLWDEKKIIGIIYVDCMIFENYFQERDLDLLATIAIISAIAIERSRLNQEIERERRNREKLQRYHSPAVVNRIIGSGGENLMRTEEKEITVLFADLVGFTTVAENLEPAEVARILNTFFSAETDVIFQNEGTLDKYIGDAVMAVFGVPFPQADHATRAVKTAIEMFQALDDLNLSGALPFTLAMRIAINSGKVVAGDIGSEKRMDYTVLGSTVNIASRIESGIAQAGEIVIGEKTKAMIGDTFRTSDLGVIPLRGLSTPMNLFRVEM